MAGTAGDEYAQWYAEQMDGYGDQSGTVSLDEWEGYFRHIIHDTGLGDAEDALRQIEICT